MAKIKRKRDSASRLLKDSMQLVVQSFDFPFVGVDFLKRKHSRIQAEDWIDKRLVMRVQGGPAKWYCVNEKGAVCEKNWIFEEKERESAMGRAIHENSKESFGEQFKYPPKQCFTTYYINRRGLYVSEDDDDVYTFPDRLHEEFIQATTKPKLSKFISQYNFCDFEDIRPRFHPYDFKPFGLPSFVTTERTAIAQMNWMHLFTKRNNLSNIISKIHTEKTVPQQDIDYLLNEISTKTKEVFIDKEKYKKLENVNVDDEFDYSKSYTSYRTDAKARLEKVIIIFGHYALCCMELLEEIKRGIPLVRYCENRKCGKSLPKDAHPLLKHHKNDPVCYKQYKAQQKKDERKNTKAYGMTKKKEKFERRYL